MRYSLLLGKTLRGFSQEAESVSLLIRGGFVRDLGGGSMALLPLGAIVIDKIKAIIQEHLRALGGQEVLLPLTSFLSLWEKSGRHQVLEKDLVRFQDHLGRTMVLSPAHEEAVIELLKTSLTSADELPLLVYQFQTRLRSGQKPSHDLAAAGEFVTKDAFSFHKSFSDLNHFFPKMFNAYKKIFEDCRVNVLPSESGLGILGGSRAYEFLMPSYNGDVTAVICTDCGYTANQDVAKGNKTLYTEKPLEMERVSVPGEGDPESLARFLNLPLRSIARISVVMTASGPVLTVVRADHGLSLEKLSQVMKEPATRPALPSELVKWGFVPGFVSPIELPKSLPVVVDNAIADGTNFVMGANQVGVCFKNINFGRDFETPFSGDIAKIGAAESCRYCHSPLKEIPCVELGQIFKWDEYFSRSLGLSYTVSQTKDIFPFMGSYTLVLGRLMAAVAESNRDAKGLLWPIRLSPFTFYLVVLADSPRVKKAAEELESRWGNACLFDDRRESSGNKLADADLLGIPFRISLSRLLLERGQAEIRVRRTQEVKLVAWERIDTEIRSLIGEAHAH